MKTGNAIILMATVALLLLVSIVAAEDFIMPQELELEETINLDNSSDNVTHAENVKRHVSPRGVMQKVILIFWNPFGRAPIDNWGFKVYNNALWYHYPDTTWIQVAFINENKQITHIQVWDQNIANTIQNNYQTVDNVTIAMVEQPPEYNIKQQETIDNADSNESIDTEKINTTINLKDQKLTNDTNTTITGILLDENGTAISDAEITITVNGQSYNEITDTNGQFTYKYNTESNDLNIGTNSMQVTYSGNETYNGISKTITITLESIEEELNDTTETTEPDDYTGSSSNYDNEIEYSNTPEDSYYLEDSYYSEEYY